METHENETSRLYALRMYDILDTAAEKAFDDLTHLAAVVCEAPISLVSLVDEHRQWFKSRQGLNATETSRDDAFCARAIDLDDDVMVVEDATLDPRFANNNLVLGDPHIKFYAGAPLKMASGHNLGTLCVIDRISRKLTKSQLEALSVLRDAVVTQLELRRNAADLKILQNFLPICAWCRCVKSTMRGVDHWSPLHDYVAKNTRVTHGICPDCQLALHDEILN